MTTIEQHEKHIEHQLRCKIDRYWNTESVMWDTIKYHPQDKHPSLIFKDRILQGLLKHLNYIIIDQCDEHIRVKLFELGFVPMKWGSVIVCARLTVLEQLINDHETGKLSDTYHELNDTQLFKSMDDMLINKIKELVDNPKYYNFEFWDYSQLDVLGGMKSGSYKLICD